MDASTELFDAIRGGDAARVAGREPVLLRPRVECRERVLPAPDDDRPRDERQSNGDQHRSERPAERSSAAPAGRG